MPLTVFVVTRNCHRGEGRCFACRDTGRKVRIVQFTSADRGDAEAVADTWIKYDAKVEEVVNG